LNLRPPAHQPHNITALSVPSRPSRPMCPRLGTLWTDRTVHPVPRWYHETVLGDTRLPRVAGTAIAPLFLDGGPVGQEGHRSGRGRGSVYGRPTVTRTRPGKARGARTTSVRLPGALNRIRSLTRPCRSVCPRTAPNRKAAPRTARPAMRTRIRAEVGTPWVNGRGVIRTDRRFKQRGRAIAFSGTVSASCLLDWCCEAWRLPEGRSASSEAAGRFSGCGWLRLRGGLRGSG
jgi:hypothetical protein